MAASTVSLSHDAAHVAALLDSPEIAGLITEVFSARLNRSYSI
jgi:hypothetical protein